MAPGLVDINPGGGSGSNTAPAATPAPTGLTSAAADPFGLGGTSQTPAPGSSTMGVGATGPISPDIASVSTWTLSQIQSYMVNLGGGLGNGGPMSIGQALTWFQNLPQSELMQIQSMLWSAGFYTDANGNPLQTAPALGSNDNQSFRAFLSAVIRAYDNSDSVTNVINNAVQTGQGANNRASLPSAVTGGGNTYNIDLSNPQDVQYTANQIFQAALGRNATAAEAQRITASLQGQEVSQGLAKEQGAEQSAQQRYGTQVNQRNIAYQFETTPKVALGPIPNGPFNGSAQASIALLQYMGLSPTQSNVQFLLGLSNAAGGTGFNLWGAQNSTPGSKPGQNGPQYSSWAQSIQATAQSLLSGPYANIFAALKTGNAASQVGNSNIQSELKKWGVGDISSQVNAAAEDAQAAVASAQQAQTPTAPAGPDQGLPGVAGRLSRIDANQNAALPGANPTASTQPGSTTPAADVTPGQTTINPGDAYINPVTVYSTNPASEASAAYNAATTGANRVQYGGYQYLQLAQGLDQMIKTGQVPVPGNGGSGG